MTRYWRERRRAPAPSPAARLKTLGAGEPPRPTMPAAMCIPCDAPADTRLCQEVPIERESEEQMLERFDFHVDMYKRVRCRQPDCQRRSCHGFHDDSDRRVLGWGDWEIGNSKPTRNKTEASYTPMLYKTVACDKERSDRCPYGKSCSFAHVLAGEPRLPRWDGAVSRLAWREGAREAIAAHFAERAAMALRDVASWRLPPPPHPGYQLALQTTPLHLTSLQLLTIFSDPDRRLWERILLICRAHGADAKLEFGGAGRGGDLVVTQSDASLVHQVPMALSAARVLLASVFGS